MQIKGKSLKELDELSSKIRERIIDVVSRKGGHFSSTLGAVELTLGMHYVFDVEEDPFIFDVSHQCYAHKLLTNRWEEFEMIDAGDGDQHRQHLLQQDIVERSGPHRRRHSDHMGRIHPGRPKAHQNRRQQDDAGRLQLQRRRLQRHLSRSELSEG